MNNPRSKYISAAKPFLKELIEELYKRYEYAHVLAVDSMSKSFRVSKNGVVVDEVPRFTKKGFVVRVYRNHAFGEYSFNELPENVKEFADLIEEKLEPMMNIPQGLSHTEYPCLSDEPLKEYRGFPVISDEQGSESYVISKMHQIRTEAFALSDKLYDFVTTFSYRVFSKYFLSGNRELEQDNCWTQAGFSALGKRGEEIKRYYKGFSALGGDGVLERARECVPEIVNGMLDLLGSERIVPGEYECICTPEVAGMIAHEAFGHGVEEDMFVKDRALAREYIGKRVASPLVTMHDGASSWEESATFFFDDEGVLAHDTLVIDKGILVSGINDSLSAMRLGVSNTGNGRRESFERKAYTRMTNTYFEGGESTVEEMIASVKYGFLLENPFSGMEDPKNWGIQLMVNMAREIKDGKLTGRVFSPIVMTGYVPELLKSISMTSKEPRLCGSGFCGKGYKEWVKVSDGGPYIKEKIRLG